MKICLLVLKLRSKISFLVVDLTCDRKREVKHKSYLIELKNTLLG